MNPIASLHQLENSPSFLDGIRSDLERNVRIISCVMIQEAGELLELPQIAIATAQVLCQRYYFLTSAKKYKIQLVSMGCLLIATKSEECTRKMQEIVSVFYYIIQRQDLPQDSIKKLDTSSRLYSEYIEVLHNVELFILSQLSFHIHVQHPHGYLLNIVNSLNLSSNKKLVQLAWNYLNDGLKTIVYVVYQPAVIACASLYLSARQLEYPLLMNPPWYDLFDVCVQDLETISAHILSLKNLELSSGRTYQSQI